MVFVKIETDDYQSKFQLGFLNPSSVKPDITVIMLYYAEYSFSVYRSFLSVEYAFFGV